MRKMILIGWFLLAALLVSQKSTAAVTDSTATGFTLVQKVVLPLKPMEAWVLFTEKIGFWWDSAHTYSGHSTNLSLDARPGGCFCERLETRGGGVEHLRVIYARPGQLLRLSGGLGPLQELPVTGIMTIRFDETPDYQTQVTMTYAVGGSRTGGWSKIAPLVDRVLGEQFGRYKNFAVSPKK